MATFVIFLRAVNVGGTGKLPMAELRHLCGELGFSSVQTYIASGNVVLTSDESKGVVQERLEAKLREYAGKDVGVIVRTPAEIQKVLENNPFPEADPKRTLAILLNRKPPADFEESVKGRNDEKLEIGTRELYVYYPAGMGSSTLRIPLAKEGTARNMNTIRKMAELASA